MKENLNIRPLKKDDLKAFFALSSEEAVAKYMRFDKTESLAEASALLDEYLKAESFVIEIDGRLEGIFSLKLQVDGEYGISVFLAQEHWGKGYFTDILKNRMSYAKKQLKAKALIGYVVDQNFGSRRVLERLGFNVDDIWEFDDSATSLYVYKKEFNRDTEAVTQD